MTDRPAGKTYADAGVDLAAAASVKDRIKDIAAATLGSAVIAGPGGFGGVIDPDPAGDTLLVASTDGVGTKLRIADALGRHDTIGVSIVNHCINDILQPKGVAVVIDALHLCMAMRGVEKQSSYTTTSSMLGYFKSNPSTRSEFLSLIQNHSRGPR